jgi:predicted PurR-regulated permease PerM
MGGPVRPPMAAPGLLRARLPDLRDREPRGAGRGLRHAAVARAAWSVIDDRLRIVPDRALVVRAFRRADRRHGAQSNGQQLADHGAALIEIKNGVVERYPTLREPLEGFLRSALSDERATVINEQLAGERARLELTEAAIADAAEQLTPPTGALAEYFNKQDRLYLNALLNEQFQLLRRYAPGIVNALYRAIATMALALLFSYLILIDQARIKHGVMRLKNSRVGDFYEEAAPPIVRFGVLLGRAIEAQAAIAVLNTLLTLIGLLLLRIPLTAMLSVVVFVCSFVPVLGVLISTTPIVLVALNAGGFGLSLAAIGLVVIVHAVEAYLLNPLIYGKHLKLNPVLTLIILYVGYHAFGFWGLLLGVPLARYFIHDVLGVPYRDRGTPKRGVTAPAPVE